MKKSELKKIVKEVMSERKNKKMVREFTESEEIAKKLKYIIYNNSESSKVKTNSEDIASAIFSIIIAMDEGRLSVPKFFAYANKMVGGM